MNILVFSWRGPKHPLAGGAEQVMHQHMVGWVEAGHKVTLFVSNIPGHPKQETIDGVNIIRGGYQYLGVQITGFLHYLQNKTKYDLVVDQFHGIPFFTPLFVRKPKIAAIQETTREVWLTNPLPKPINWLVGIIGYLGEPFIFLLYRKTAFITGSQSAKHEIQKYGIKEKNITVIPHGVIVKKPKKKITKQKTKTILFLGVLSKDKGIEDALKAFSLLNKKGEYKFWVIGKADRPEYKNKLTQLTNKLNIQQKTKFFGFVSQEKKFELLARAHMLINPSIREGWGLVNIEANAMGTPVVAYNSPGLIDSVVDNKTGIICKQNTPSSLANNTHNLLSDKKKYMKLAKAAQKWSEGFTWQKSKAQSLELVEQIARN